MKQTNITLQTHTNTHINTYIHIHTYAHTYTHTYTHTDAPEAVRFKHDLNLPIAPAKHSCRCVKAFLSSLKSVSIFLMLISTSVARAVMFNDL